MMTGNGGSAPPSNLLLATDLSSRSDRALDRAVQLAGEWKAKLHIVHSLTASSEALVPDSVWDSPWRRSDDLFQQAEQRLRSDLGPAIEKLKPRIHIERGSPGQAVLDVAKRHECGLIITGVARDETLGRMLLGDTVDFLTRASTVPVLVVRERIHGPYSQVWAATDFSPASAEAMQVALALFPRSQVRLLHAYRIPFSGILMNNSIRAEFQQLGEKAALEFLRAQGLPEDLPRTVEQGSPEQMISEHVEPDGSLVVIGSHGASALSTILLGSTARRILHRTDRDVLLVPFTKRNAA